MTVDGLALKPSIKKKLCLLTHCLLSNFSCLLLFAGCFQNQPFRKILSEISSECQIVWIQTADNTRSLVGAKAVNTIDATNYILILISILGKMLEILFRAKLAFLCFSH